MYIRVVYVVYLDSLVLDSHISLSHTPIDCFFFFYQASLHTKMKKNCPETTI